ncbi:ComEA family DNA-binding protein [Geotalea toluenoxydans]
MTVRSQRFIVWLFAFFLVASLLYKGHCLRTKTGPAVAFLSWSTGRVTVRIKGDVSRSGVYRLPDGSTIGTVTNMTILDPAFLPASDVNLQISLKPGMILDVKQKGQNKYALSISYMKAKERLILGVPLDLGLMEEDDWEALPGIGPKTAKDIVDYRQDNGGFCPIEELKSVKGISEGKVEKIMGFFMSK